MTAHSTDQSTGSAQAGDPSLPSRPSRDNLTEQNAPQLCGALSGACQNAHEFLVGSLRRENFPSAITNQLSINRSHDESEGVLALSEGDRQALLRLAQESLRTTGVIPVGGITDFIGYAKRFEALKAPWEMRTDVPVQLRQLVHDLTERLIVTLSTATSPLEKQLSLVGLNGLIHACRPFMRTLSDEIEDATRRALAATAEIPLWAYNRE